MRAEFAFGGQVNGPTCRRARHAVGPDREVFAVACCWRVKRQPASEPPQ